VSRNAWEPKATIKSEADTFCISFTPDASMMACGGGDGVIRIFQTGSTKLLYSLGVDHTKGKLQLPVTTVKFRPATKFSKTKNVLISGNCEGEIQHWHATSQKCLSTITEPDNQVFSLDYHPEGSSFASTGKDAKVRVYDESTKTLVSTLDGGWGRPTPGHSNRVFCVKYKPDDPNIILSAGWDNTIQVWDTRLNYAVRSIYGPHVCGDAMDIHGDTILTGSWRPDSQIQMWDFASGKNIYDYSLKRSTTGYDSLLYGAAFDKSGKMYATAGAGCNEAHLWLRATGECIGSTGPCETPLFTAQWSPDSSMVAIGGSGQEISLYSVQGMLS